MKKIVSMMLFAVLAFAEVKTFTKTIRQSFGGAQSPDDARLSAIKKLESDISREAGEYISTNTVLKDSKIVSDDITAISASILKSKVVSEKSYTEGTIFGLEITVSSTLDTNTIDAQINKILASKENLSTIKELKKQNDKLLAKIKELEAKNAKAQTAKEKKQLKEDFVKSQDMAKAIEFYDNGYEAVVKGDYQLAIKNYTLAIKEKPNFAEAYYNRGHSYANLNDQSSAIRDYTEAIRINPKYTEAYIMRGNSYQKLNDHSSAIRDFTEAIGIDPKDAVSYYNRGLSYVSLSDLSSAIRDCTEAIRIDPKFAMAYNNRGILYVNLNKLVEASKDARKACSLGNCSLVELMGKNGILRD